MHYILNFKHQKHPTGNIFCKFCQHLCQNKNMKTSFFLNFPVCLNVFRLPHDWCSQSNNQHSGLNACLYSIHQHAKGQVDYGMSWEHTHTQYWCHVTLIDVRKSHTYSEALRENAWSWDEVFSASQAIDKNLVDLSDSSDWAAFVLNYHCQPDRHWRREQSRKIKTRRSQRLKGAGLFSLLTVRIHLATIQNTLATI